MNQLAITNLITDSFIVKWPRPTFDCQFNSKSIGDECDVAKCLNQNTGSGCHAKSNQISPVNFNFIYIFYFNQMRRCHSSSINLIIRVGGWMGGGAVENCNFRAVLERSAENAVHSANPEHFQSNIGAISEQFQCNLGIFSDSKRISGQL